jgi:hypothetical protein
MHPLSYIGLWYTIAQPLLAQTTTDSAGPQADSQTLQWQTQNDPPIEPFSYDDIVLVAGGNVSATVRLGGWEGCDVRDPCNPDNPDRNKRQVIKAGFVEMQKMIPDAFRSAPDPSDPPVNRYDIDWESAPAIEFFGSWRKTRDYKSLVQENMNALAAQRSEEWFDWTIHVRCDDPAQECESETNAYVLQNGGFENHINFCDPYFKLSSLDIAVDTRAGSRNLEERDKLFGYLNRGTFNIHA